MVMNLTFLLGSKQRKGNHRSHVTCDVTHISRVTSLTAVLHGDIVTLTCDKRCVCKTTAAYLVQLRADGVYEGDLHAGDLVSLLSVHQVLSQENTQRR